MLKEITIYLLLTLSLTYCSGSKGADEKKNSASKIKKSFTVLEIEKRKFPDQKGGLEAIKIYGPNEKIKLKSSEILGRAMISVSSDFVKKYIQNNPKMAVQNNDAHFKLERGIWGKVKLKSGVDNILIYEKSGVDVMEHKLFLLTFDSRQNLKGTLEVANTTNFADSKLRISSKLTGNIIKIKRVTDEAGSGKEEKNSPFRVTASGKIMPVVTGAYSKPNPHGIRLWHNFKNPFSRKNLLAAKPRLFIIGWSGNGKIAYITENFQDGIGAVFYYWAIQDLVSDKILWSKRDTEDEATKRMQSGINAQSPQFFSAMFEKKLPLYRGIMKKFGIVNHTENRLSYLPWRKRNLTYNIKVTSQKQPSPHFGIDIVRAYQVKVGKNGKSKQVANIKKASGGTLDVQPLGFFQSPYEKRAAVLIAEIQRGWEGPPHDIRLKIFGALLSKGFK